LPVADADLILQVGTPGLRFDQLVGVRAGRVVGSAQQAAVAHGVAVFVLEAIFAVLVVTQTELDLMRTGAPVVA